MSPTVLPHTHAVRYVTALKEGGSLPGIVEADDDGTYVVKFRGAGQGPSVLVAEVVVASLAARLGLRVPELVTIDVDEAIGRREPDPEIQDLLLASVGVNLGVDFLPGSVGYDGQSFAVPVAEAAAVWWLDAFTANIDRTWRNPNLLVWHGQLWTIDHGAALVFQHSWPDPAVWARRGYDLSAHVLAPVLDAAPGGRAVAVAEADARARAVVDAAAIDDALALVPDAWLQPRDSLAADPRARLELAVDAEQAEVAAAARARYRDYLVRRLDGGDAWLGGAAGGGGR
ncbi:MAG: HipA family kinase [Kineosporiaceae bacterium]